MAKTAKAKTPHSSFAQTKETLGSILFALILALVFRGFIGQAFVIPTGSMAPTLSGKHFDQVCTSCGYRFAVSLDNLDHAPTRVLCPNCGNEDRLERPPLVDAGDGIFTLSWPFAVGGPLSPDRWDVVVFKAPFRIQLPPARRDGQTDGQGLLSLLTPLERDGETNYIKRLIGLPGDILEIIDGDVYLARAAEVSDSIRTKLAKAPLPEPLTADEQKELDARLQIARKTAQAQQALWQIVFDADYRPTRPTTNGSGPAWQPLEKTSAWKPEGRGFGFDGESVEQPQYLELTGKDFRDFYGYNVGMPTFQIVSDLQLAATINWQGGDGRVHLCLSKYDDLYTIELQPRQGTGRTLQAKRSSPQESREIQAWSFPAWKRNQPVRVGFTNVDRRLEVRINDRVIWQHDLAMTAAQARGYTYEQARPTVRIGAAGARVQLSHIRLSRDVCYHDDADIRTFVSMNREEDSPYRGKRGWGTRGNPILLRDGEYFVLGDNSPASLDSRRWWQTGKHLAGRDYRVGTVPADQMIGKAFFVYWPSWYRLWDIPALRVIPNIGEMRWIE